MRWPTKITRNILKKYWNIYLLQIAYKFFFFTIKRPYKTSCTYTRVYVGRQALRLLYSEISVCGGVRWRKRHRSTCVCVYVGRSACVSVLCWNVYNNNHECNNPIWICSCQQWKNQQQQQQYICIVQNNWILMPHSYTHMTNNNVWCTHATNGHKLFLDQKLYTLE